MFLNNNTIKISEDKYKYFMCNFDEKNNYTHTLLKKKHVINIHYVVKKKKKLKGTWYLSKV